MEPVLPLSRRAVLALGAKAALGAAVLSMPEVLYRPPWTRLAAAQNVPNVEMNFTAAVEAVTTVPDVATARWIIAEFDTALEPLPDRVAVTAAVSAVLDAMTVAGGHSAAFFSATPDQRREVLGGMVRGDDPDIRQIANQLIPFCGFGYWCDATMPEPAQPGGPRLERWDAVGFPGPSHGYADSYMRGSPPGFAPMTDFES